MIKLFILIATCSITALALETVFQSHNQYDELRFGFNQDVSRHPQKIALVDSIEEIHSLIKTNSFLGSPNHFCLRSGGHSYTGSSTCNGTIIDLKKLNHKSVEYIDGIPYATVGTGNLNHQIYEELAKYNLTISGGTCGMVGVGGYMSGGGYGFNHRAYGVGVDNIVSARVLLANGKIVNCSEENYSDLFWAIRGGGGNTYGTVLDFTIRAYRLESVVRVFWKDECNTLNKDCDSKVEKWTKIIRNMIDYMSKESVELAGAHLELFRFEDGLGRLELNMNWHGMGVNADYVRSRMHSK